MNALLSYKAILVVCGVGLAVSTAEYWVIAPSFNPGALYPWSILSLRCGRLLSGIQTFNAREVRALVLVRALALLLMLFSPLGGYTFVVALGFLVSSTAVLHLRVRYDDDASDGMNAVILITVLICINPLSTPFTVQAGLWFIALQASLCYATSGISKIASASWRRGEALNRIFDTNTYGLDAISHQLGKRPTLQFLLCWSVMLTETLFPLGLLFPHWVWIFLAWGISFHLLCAVIMGFNSFLWAFTATYPAILYVAQELETGGR